MVWLQCLSDSRCGCILTAGRGLPPSDGVVQRGKGVALVLLGDAIVSWEVAGKQWKSWSARMVSACFRIGEKPHDILHVASYYAPTCMGF